MDNGRLYPRGTVLPTGRHGKRRRVPRGHVRHPRTRLRQTVPPRHVRRRPTRRGTPTAIYSDHPRKRQAHRRRHRRHENGKRVLRLKRGRRGDRSRVKPTGRHYGNYYTLYGFLFTRPISTLPSRTRRRGVLGSNVLQVGTISAPRNANVSRRGFRYHRHHSSYPSTRGMTLPIVNIHGTLRHTRRGRQYARPPRRARPNKRPTHGFGRVVSIVRRRRRRHSNLRLNAVRTFFHRFVRASSPFFMRSIWRRGL